MFLVSEKPILFYDSGIGGLPYLTHLRDRIPHEDFIYVADSKNFPYGDKSEEILKKIIVKTVTEIIKEFNPKVVVVACNTASVTALKELREVTSIPIVGVVPAIKTASGVTKNNKIGVLATNRTVHGDYLKKLIIDFSSDKEVYLVGASDIVSFVENNMHSASSEYINCFITKAVSPLKGYDIDSVVLGCTHFIHVANQIKDALGGDVQVIDSREGVSNQVERVINKKEYTDKKGKALFYTTSKINNRDNYKGICNYAGLDYMGDLYK